MRLTRSLRYAQGVRRGRTEKYEFLSRDMWRNKARFMNVNVPRLRPEVQAAVERHQPEDMFTSDRYEREIRAATLPNLDWRAPDESKWLWRHPRDRQEPGRVFRWRSRFEHAEQQASALTKTIVRRQLPQRLQRAADAQELTSDDLEMLERSVMRSHYWHTEESRYPRRFDPHKIAYKYRADFGVSVASIVRFMLADWFRWAQMRAPSDRRLLLRDSFLETVFTCRGVPVHLQEARDFHLVGDQPLPLLADEDEVSRTETQPLPSLYPLSPLLDLPESLQYDGSVSSCGLDSRPHSQLLSASFDLPNLWCNFDEPEARPVTPEQRAAAAVVGCFGQALAQARAAGAEADESGRLRRPVVVAGVFSDGVHFDFACYQLNTVGLDAEDGVKNLAWVEPGLRLFEKAVPLRGPLRQSRNSQLQPSVFAKFLAMHSLGLPS